ncbi:protein ASPARTIC PROTEASE IN GUARD CELL 2 [Selaginella moellendorffii]|nr:protein ASPARTIC PROTEASE IN GUARD CELL 2 [Selaginella moellendorffii]|eukprot:XP_002961719.2 protein ASPARTIC PROTEASE IN GUARD CELL 2 [Selaginella moellendorffii]
MKIFVLILFATLLSLRQSQELEGGHKEHKELITFTPGHFKILSFPPFASRATAPAAANPRPQRQDHELQGKEEELAIEILHRSSRRDGDPHYQDPLHDIHSAMERDEARLRWIHHRIQSSDRRHRRGRSLLQTAQISSGLSLGSGEYFARMGIGNPQRSYYLELDTGSDVTWIQCAPCSSCYSQVDPIYDPSNSSSYRRVYCGSALCQALDYSACQGMGCSYRVVYGDSSASSGDLGIESFYLGPNSSTAMRNIAFGCGHSNSGLFRGEAGLLGMGGGTLSFFSQIAASIGPAFSYCLVDRYSQLQSRSSPLIFGRTAIPFAARFTPLLKNPRINTFYYAVLTGISVGGTPLPIPPAQFALTGNGTGGAILDSGTSVTRVVPPAYAVLRDAYRAASRNLPPAPGVYLLDTCFNFQGLPTVQIPSLVLHFDNGVDMVLPGGNILIPVDRSGTFCLAFAPSSMPISVIGNVQQQTFRIGFDLQRSLIAIAPREC